MNTTAIDENLKLVSVILSIGTIICPIVFGYVLWKMNSLFVSKEEFIAFKNERSKEQDEMKLVLYKLQADISELLQRTAHLRATHDKSH